MIILINLIVLQWQVHSARECCWPWRRRTSLTSQSSSISPISLTGFLFHLFNLYTLLFSVFRIKFVLNSVIQFTWQVSQNQPRGKGTSAEIWRRHLAPWLWRHNTIPRGEISQSFSRHSCWICLCVFLFSFSSFSLSCFSCPICYVVYAELCKSQLWYLNHPRVC